MPTESVDQLIEQLKNLKVQENVVLEKLSRAREQEKEAQNRNRTPRNTTYKVGDRVRITNGVTVPFARNANERDRTATVRYTKPHNEHTKVYITTDNGFRTWRLEKNLRRIP
jgi:transcription antitermination factor NusG